MTRIILASQSPRRHELLTKMGLEFDVVPSEFDEQLDNARSPQEVAAELALGKALAVADTLPDAIVIGADTIVTIDGEQLGKPGDADEALAMLGKLSGKSHQVTTGLAVIHKADGRKLVETDTATVHFKPYDAKAVEQYVASGDPLDKAGAYGIQSGAAVLVEYIKGNYDTIIGLPTGLLASMLSDCGIEAQALRLALPVAQK